jgi:L-ascorbate metabolism protein UlaG (beta-lactamase superfamily)
MIRNLTGIIRWLQGIFIMRFNFWVKGAAIFMLLVVTADNYYSQTTEVNLRYIGHASFEWITPKGTKIIIDPYNNSWWSHWFDQSFPPLTADLVLVTHPHFDHNAVNKIMGTPEVMNQPGVKEENDYIVYGISGHHARSDKYGHENTIFVVEINGIRFCHLGDNDADITDELKQQLGRIDVLLIPVDESEHLLTLGEVAMVIERLAPRIVVPMHYFNPGLTSNCSTLQPINKWLNQQSRLKKIPPEGVRLTIDALPSEREVWVFERVDESKSQPLDSNYFGLPCFLRALGTQIICLSLIAGGLLYYIWFRKFRFRQ